MIYFFTMVMLADITGHSGYVSAGEQTFQTAEICETARATKQKQIEAGDADMPKGMTAYISSECTAHSAK